MTLKSMVWIAMELGGGPYPPRTMVEVRALNDNDIFEVEGTFFAPPPAAAGV